MVTPAPLFNFPTGGGWGLRFFPQGMILSTVRNYERKGQPAVLYLHPREVDPLGPRLSLPPLQRFATYGPRSDVSPRIQVLLRQFHFTTLGELVDSWPAAS